MTIVERIDEAAKKDSERKAARKTAALTAFPYILVLIILGAMLSGWVTTVLWRWFVVPPLGLRPLNIPQALGLTFVARVLVGFNPKPNKSDPDDTALDLVAKDFGTSILWPLLLLGVAWLVHLFL